MSDLVIAEESIDHDAPTATQITSIMAYIRGLVMGSLQQEHLELLHEVYGVQDVNRMVALGGVKYLISIISVAQDRVNIEGVSLKEVLTREHEQVVSILDKIFGEE
jgi:hypothetical protein